MFLTPLKEPKYKFFLACCVQMFFVGTIHVFLDQFGDYQIAMIMIARFVLGLTRAYMIIPYLILTHHYDPTDEG